MDLFLRKDSDILKKYPTHVRNNLREYLLATELLRIFQGMNNLELSKRRIKKLLNKK